MKNKTNIIDIKRVSATMAAIQAAEQTIDDESSNLIEQQSRFIEQLLMFLELQNESDMLSINRVCKLSGWHRSTVMHLIERKLLDTVAIKSNVCIPLASYLKLRLQGCDELIKNLKKGGIK